MSLPPLREELALFPGPTLSDGQPSYTLHDPTRNLFFQIDWPTFEILAHWSLSDAQTIAHTINENTTLHLTSAEVMQVAEFLFENQLLIPQPGTAKIFDDRLRKIRGSFASKLLHNYLFFRIPLFKPDKWLTQTLPYANLFFTNSFFALTLVALFIGLIEVARDWTRFTATLIDHITWAGLLSYGISIVFVKALHELGHAFTAKRFGCRVPAMGVAFLVLFPVPYTDTNDVWKLTSRNQRLAVAAAGIVTELVLASWATFAWAFLPEGQIKSIAFLLATTTWISTLAINASPFMRFDGYFLASDFFEIPNLHSRAFALARWDLRDRLFKLNETPPEFFPKRRHYGLILFAWATWIYRLILFIGIAILVYSFFIKAVGIILFLVEMIWFVFLPIWKEIKIWRECWPRVQNKRRSKLIAAATLVVFVFFVPLPGHVRSSALLQPSERWIVYAPEHAQIKKRIWENGAFVTADAVLIEFDSSELQSNAQRTQARVDQLRWSSAAATFDAEQRTQWQSAQEAFLTAEEEAAGVAAELERYYPRAPFAGRVWYIDPELTPHQWVQRNEPVLLLANPHHWQIITYLDGNEITRIVPGANAHFYLDDAKSTVMSLEVTRVDTDASRTLPEAELAADYGGDILVRKKDDLLYPEKSIYRVTLTTTQIPEHLAEHAWRGRIVINARWQALGTRFIRSALNLIWREAGF